MKRLLKTLGAGLLLATFTGAALQLSAAPIPAPGSAPDDTIVVKLANEAVMTLVVKNARQLESFQKHSLDSLMIMINTYVNKAEVVDKKEAARKSQEKTIYFYPAKEKGNENGPDEIKITVTGTKKTKSTTPAPGGTETEELIVGNLFKVVVTYSDDGKTTKISTAAVNSDTTKTRKKTPPSRWDNSVNIDLGYNAFTNQNNLDPDFELRPYGSRYVGISRLYRARIGGPGSPVSLRSGVELAFNNYMFSTGRVLVNQQNQTMFVTDTTRNINRIQKQKLATTTINVPLTAIIQFRDSKNKDAFRVGAGGFVGYRIGSQSKLKYESNDRKIKDKDPGNYNLEDLQYGINGLVGFKSINFFGRYNMNSLFRENRGPDTNVVSFGLTLTL